MKYDIDYFIRKFEAIPEEKWGIIFFSMNNRSCALGHCGMRQATNSTLIAYEVTHTDESMALSLLMGSVREVGGVNDGFHSDYQQDTPKRRILAALYDLKVKEPKEKIVYVTVDKKVRELQSQTLCQQ